MYAVICMYIVRVLMRDEKEEKKKQARSNKQKQSNIAHPRQSLLSWVRVPPEAVHFF